MEWDIIRLFLLDKEHMIRGKWTDEELGEHATRLYGQKFVFEVPKNGKTLQYQ